MASLPARGQGLRILGHPLHAALSAFPLALLSGAVIADVIAFVHDSQFWWAASFWLVVGGLLFALPTAGAGFFDFLTIVRSEGAAKTATRHMLVMLSSVSCFGIDLLMRGRSAAPVGAMRFLTVALDAAGAMLITIGGWYGGELVFRHGVGVHRELDAGNDNSDPHGLV